MKYRILIIIYIYEIKIKLTLIVKKFLQNTRFTTPKVGTKPQGFYKRKIILG